MPLVEVVAVLEPNEQYAFDGLVAQLRADDPAFARRVDRIATPRGTLRTALAVLLWTLAPACVVFGGWTGLILAVVGALYAARLMSVHSRRPGEAGGGSWWSSSDRRPGASL
jgi:fatty acid desaturase